MVMTAWETAYYARAQFPIFLPRRFPLPWEKRIPVEQVASALGMKYAYSARKCMFPAML